MGYFRDHIAEGIHRLTSDNSSSIALGSLAFLLLFGGRHFSALPKQSHGSRESHGKS